MSKINKKQKGIKLTLRKGTEFSFPSIILNDEDETSICINPPQESDEVAAFICLCVNNHQKLVDLLKEFVKMQNDPTYGDLVWRLSVKEKAKQLLQSLEQ